MMFPSIDECVHERNDRALESASFLTLCTCQSDECRGQVVGKSSAVCHYRGVASE